MMWMLEIALAGVVGRKLNDMASIICSIGADCFVKIEPRLKHTFSQRKTYGCRK